MGFKIEDLLKPSSTREVSSLRLPEVRCPTGKHVFQTKDDARAALKRHSTQWKKDRRHDQGVFRCGFCGFIHIGHRRGKIL